MKKIQFHPQCFFRPFFAAFILSALLLGSCQKEELPVREECQEELKEVMGLYDPFEDDLYYAQGYREVVLEAFLAFPADGDRYILPVETSTDGVEETLVRLKSMPEDALKAKAQRLADLYDAQRSEISTTGGSSRKRPGISYFDRICGDTPGPVGKTDCQVLGNQSTDTEYYPLRQCKPARGSGQTCVEWYRPRALRIIYNSTNCGGGIADLEILRAYQCP